MARWLDFAFENQSNACDLLAIESIDSWVYLISIGRHHHRQPARWGLGLEALLFLGLLLARAFVSAADGRRG